MDLNPGTRALDRPALAAFDKIFVGRTAGGVNKGPNPIDVEAFIEGLQATGGFGTGNVVGPGASTNNRLAVFDGITGKLLKDSGVAIGNTAGNVPVLDGGGKLASGIIPAIAISLVTGLSGALDGLSAAVAAKVPLAGGTMSGSLGISRASYPAFMLNRDDAGNSGYLMYLRNGVYDWILEATDVGIGMSRFVGGAWQNSPLSILQATGAVTLGTAGATTNLIGDVRANGNTVWHAGNDGAGSGSDADRLDGYEASTLLGGEMAMLATGATAAANAATLQAVINTMTSGNVFIPAGAYECNAVTMKPGVRIKGRGRDLTILKAGENSINQLGYTASGSLKTNFGVVDIGFDANGKSGVTAVSLDGGSAGVRISEASLERLRFVGTHAQAVDLRFCANSVLNELFATSAVDAYVIDCCADTDVIACKAQLGSGYGFKVIGIAGPYDEGVRLNGCSTNGQHIGLLIDGQDYGLASNCSFTTCPGGSLIAQGSSSNWKFSSCDFANAGSPGPSMANVDLGVATSRFTFAGCNNLLGTFGFVLRGSGHSIVNTNCNNNTNVDVYLDDATGCTIVGNVLESAAVAWSILEVGAADYNVIGMNRSVGSTTLVGAHSGMEVGAMATFSGGLLSKQRITVNTDLGTFSGSDPALVLQGSKNAERMLIQSHTAGAGSGATIYLLTGRGTLSAPAVSRSGDRLGAITGGGFYNTGISDYERGGAIIEFVAGANWTPTSRPTAIKIGVMNIGSVTRTEVVRILPNGDVRIGSNGVALAKLDVDGTGLYSGNLGVGGVVSAAGFYNGLDKLVGPRATGWATATGTATRTTFATGSVTLPQLAERVKALIDDLHAAAGHGLIGA